MSLHDLFEMIDIPVVTNATGFLTALVLISMTIIQIAPIKINPWDFLLGWIGDRLNSHIIKKVDSLDAKLTEHVEESRDSSIKRKRARILQFVEDGMGGKCYTKETFDFMITECDEYEEYIEKCGRKNGVIEASIKEIRRRYSDHIHNNDFADLSEIDLQDQLKLNQNQK